MFHNALATFDFSDSSKNNSDDEDDNIKCGMPTPNFHPPQIRTSLKSPQNLSYVPPVT